MARCFIEEAIASLFPGQFPQYSLDGETVAGLTWLDPVLTEPTEGEVTAALAAAEAAWDATAYLRAREAAYVAQGVTPATTAEALYLARVESDTTALDAIAAKRAVVDADNPEPMEA